MQAIKDKTTTEIKVLPVRRKSLAEEIISEFKKLIDSGHLSPGGQLPGERALAEMLKVSRPSLREALRALIVLGIIDSRHGSGHFLAKSVESWNIESLGLLLTFNKGALFDIYEARVSLDCTAAGLAAERRTEEEIEAMELAIKTSKNEIGNHELFMKCDLDFHKIVAASTKNQVLMELLYKLYKMFFGVRIDLHIAGLTIDFNYKDHEEILSHIKAKRAEDAAMAMRKHLTKYQQQIYNYSNKA
jgi:GntR family transcriptional regulator, transcriptional repressor for pyruvate dehydrogenase complex